MFTGIIQHQGRVADIEANDFGSVFHVDVGGWNHHPSIGDSISLNGCCLTVASVEPPAGSGRTIFRFDVIRQTLEITTLGGLGVGDPVNLEHAVTPQTMLGGHIVQGHIDGVGQVASVMTDPSQWRIRIEPYAGAMPCIVEKGSIAVDGVSLTVAATGPDWFEVALIPTTLRLTTLGTLKAGAGVNLEIDYIARIVTNWLARTRS